MSNLEYFLGHVISQDRVAGGGFRSTSTRYATTPVQYDPPEAGQKVLTVRCAHCGRDITMDVRSKKKIWLLRMRGLGLIALAAPLLWLVGIKFYENLSETLRSVFGVICFAMILLGLELLFKRESVLAFSIKNSSHHFILSKRSETSPGS